jgi:hypothetical protein
MNTNNLNKNYTLPDILIPELKLLDKRLDKAYERVIKYEKDIHPSISFIDAVRFVDMGIDVTQLKPELYEQYR